jgi:decaprenyl-phosphate phosphoribosyltransferase
MVGYCLWAFEKSANKAGVPWYELSIVPFVLAVLRYALLVERGEGGAPEDLVLRDRPLQVMGLLWVVLVGIALYVA